jgi:hypothetical protein
MLFHIKRFLSVSWLFVVIRSLPITLLPPESHGYFVITSLVLCLPSFPKMFSNANVLSFIGLDAEKSRSGSQT